MTTTVPTAAAATLGPGTRLGEYVLGAPRWRLRIADAFRGTGPAGAVTIYVVHAAIASNPQARDAVIAGARAAAAIASSPNRIKTVAAGLTGSVLWIAAEDFEGTNLRDMLEQKRKTGQGSLGLRGCSNLTAGVTAGLEDVIHGALIAESIVLDKAGGIRVADYPLAEGTRAAIMLGLVPASSGNPPELAGGAAPTPAADVYCIGALVYETLLGRPLERGGPRPSEALAGLTSKTDALIARACHRDPAERFGRPDVLGEIIVEALGRGGAVADEAAGYSGALPLMGAASGSHPGIRPPCTPSGVVSSAAVEKLLAAAEADPAERWLVARGKLDYGPYPLAEIIRRIDAGTITADDIIIDKDSGLRAPIGAHPVLAPLASSAQQRIDDQRRAHAEVAHQKKEQKRGAMLVVLIGLGLAAVGGGGYLFIESTRDDAGKQEVASVDTLGGASLDVRVSEPTKPARQPRTAGGRGGGGGNTGANGGDEALALDMSGEDDGGSETLDLGTVYSVYSHYGSQLGGCLQKNGGGTANISIVIQGDTGRVTYVRVNGQAGGGLATCIGGVMRTMKFPTVNGPRTRAEFDVST